MDPVAHRSGPPDRGSQHALLREVALPKRADGVAQKQVEFQTTKPLPSYLLAFGVGPFDILDGGKVSPTPVRFITPKGRAQDASYAASITPPSTAEAGGVLSVSPTL